MKRVLSIVIVTSLFTLSVLQSHSSAASKIVLGYYTNSPSSTKSFKSNYKYMNQIATDTFQFDFEGKVFGTVPEDTIALANSKHINTFAVVSNYGKTDWDSELAHTVLSNPTLKRKFISNLLTVASRMHYAGINIDFEAVLPNDRTLFSNFIQDLSKSLKKKGYLLMVSVPAKSKENLKDSWSGAYDYNSLGKRANFIQIMTYDETGYWWNLPGSTASTPWIDASLKYATKLIDSKKVLMGIGAYGNDWNITSKNLSDNHRVPLIDIPTLLASTGAKPLRDKNSNSMYFYYKDTSGDTHEVWYDDSTSITKKAHFTMKYHLGGISIYAIGMEGPGFWKAINLGLR
ncbi:glycosyl hydrolase family 18 protein [Gottfriedia luciferensis]|uniref:glycosyl hydrolase family 18 protein n=1 Tax=Gottfriedia luciferensis TaxID=178774 RepID=UPI000B44FB44|nr:glycosyl hydrolase family 18 protein [Gottfriedia luciferensis]